MQAYALFTYDKVIGYILKPMGSFKSDYLSRESWKLFKKFEDSPSQYREQVYYQNFLRRIAPNNEPEFLVRIGKDRKN
jgi:hypothetical protein